MSYDSVPSVREWFAKLLSFSLATPTGSIRAEEKVRERERATMWTLIANNVYINILRINEYSMILARVRLAVVESSLGYGAVRMFLLLLCASVSLKETDRIMLCINNTKNPSECMIIRTLRAYGWPTARYVFDYLDMLTLKCTYFDHSDARSRALSVCWCAVH